MTIHSRVPAADYFALPELSISKLKQLARSPLHYRYFLDHPKESPAMTLGTAAHCATLEPERFSRDFVVWDRKTDSGRSAPRNGKAWDAFVAESAGREVLTADEYQLAIGMAGAVRTDPVAAKYLASGDPEATMQWALGERRCKGRADWITRLDGEDVIVGLKTARENRHFAFGAAAARLGYTMQWAWYFDGYLTITGRKPRMVEIVVESAAPHSVIVYFIPDDVLDYGRDEYQNLLRVLGECEASGEWPGPALTEQALSLPSWCFAGDEDLSELQLET